MTVQGLPAAKALVKEIGKAKVMCVYRFCTNRGEGVQYAVFTREMLVDIYNNAFVIDPELVYTKEGGWLDDSSTADW